MTTWRWTSLVGAGLRAMIHGRIDRLSDLSFWKMDTARVQRAQLRRLLREASGTEVGRTHGFAHLATLDDEAIDLVVVDEEHADCPRRAQGCAHDGTSCSRQYASIVAMVSTKAV